MDWTGQTICMDVPQTRITLYTHYTVDVPDSQSGEGLSHRSVEELTCVDASVVLCVVVWETSALHRLPMEGL